MAEMQPVRLDFFGDEIETIRQFDPATQRTIAKLESILVAPAREYLTPDTETLDTGITEFHIPLLHPFPASIFDYLPAKALVAVDDLSLIEGMMQEVEEQAVRFRKESIEEDTLGASFPVPYITWSELHDSLGDKSLVEMGRASEQS